MKIKTRGSIKNLFYVRERATISQRFLSERSKINFVRLKMGMLRYYYIYSIRG